MSINFVQPKTFMIGYTTLDTLELSKYLNISNQKDFWNDIHEHWDSQGDGKDTDLDCLISFYAKLCYASLTTDKNDNITRTRSIKENIINTLAHGHGSVFEHVMLNFVTTDCSRVFTHELVRHRVGTAFSQTSGRYVRTQDRKIVINPNDPILQDPTLATSLGDLWDGYDQLCADTMADVSDFDTKKKLTSSLRRMLPNGQANEIGWSINIRALRHVIMLRTNRHAEWEMRHVFNEVYQIVKERFPLLFHDAKEEMVDGYLEITGMVTQPY